MRSFRWLFAGMMVLGACKRRAQHDEDASATPRPAVAAARPDASAATRPAPDAAVAQDPIATRVARTTALSPTPREVTAGRLRLTATRCALDGAALVAGTVSTALPSIAFDRRGALYLADSDQRVRRYTRVRGEACRFALDATFGTGGVRAFSTPITHVSTGRGDALVASGPRGSYALEAGAITVRCDRSAHGAVSVAKSGYGYGVAPGAAVRRVEYEDGACAITPWTYEHPLRGVVALAIDDENMLIAGPASNGAVQVGIVDERGHDRERFGAATQGADDAFCSVSALGACAAGVCVLDTACDRLRLWTSSGRHTANVVASELLGVARPGLHDIEAGGRGEVFIAASALRAPAEASVYEGMLFSVSGM